MSRNIAWLESMRQEGGYGGPVVHYWRDCLGYTGPGIDWRYEGIICGFLNLYKKTGNRSWLGKAEQAADDVVNGQLSNGCFHHSCFEGNDTNITSGGTPHEAAVDIGLLRLAETLKEEKNKKWIKYLSAAKKNIDYYHIKLCWSTKRKTFRQDPRLSWFVANKISTTIEAIILLGKLIEKRDYIEKYAIPSGEFLLSQQNLVENLPIYGGIYQEERPRLPRKGHYNLIAFYNARCVPGLLTLYDETRDSRYLSAAKRVGKFIKSMERSDGSFWFGWRSHYGSWESEKYPLWIAGTGDILRALYLLNEKGEAYDLSNGLKWLLKGMDENGGVRTSWGLHLSRRFGPFKESPNWRDVLHVVGWNDKAFRFLTELIPHGSEISSVSRPIDEIKICCNSNIVYCENSRVIKIYKNDVLSGPTKSVFFCFKKFPKPAFAVPPERNSPAKIIKSFSRSIVKILETDYY